MSRFRLGSPGYIGRCIGMLPAALRSWSSLPILLWRPPRPTEMRSGCGSLSSDPQPQAMCLVAVQTCPIGDRDQELHEDVGQGERALGHGRQQLGRVGERKHGSLRSELALGAGGRSALGSGVEAPNLNERLLVVAPELLQRGHGITFAGGSGRAAQYADMGHFGRLS